MAVFCLVHGSSQSSAGWKLLVAELTRRGHEAIAVDLPRDEPDANATRYADVIAATLRDHRAPDDVIVVAHSVSGIFLPLVPSRHPTSRLVYLAVALPHIGMSALDQFRADPSMLNPAWVGKDPTDDAVAREFLFHDCPPELVEWAWRPAYSSTPQPPSRRSAR